MWIPDGRNIENDRFDLVDKLLKVEMVDSAAEIHYKAKNPPTARMFAETAWL